VSAPTLLTIDRTSVENTVQSGFIKGRRFEECPRRGYSILTKYDGKRVIIQTRCKTKRCVPCGPAVKAHVALKAEIGCLMYPDSYFMTVTLKMGMERPKDAVFVQKAWRGLVSRLKYETDWWKQVKWMKVVEITKRGQPHLHLVVTNVPGGKRDRCVGNRNDKGWVDNGCFNAGESCIHHDVARAWARVTEKLGNESWVVDVSKIRSSVKAGMYVSKYITKGGEDGRLADLGFKRLWSASKGFSPDLRIRLRGTVEGKWQRVEYWQPQQEPVSWLEYSDGDRDLELTGHPLVMEKYEARQRARKITWVKEIMRGYTTDKQTDHTETGSGEHRQGGGIRAVA
jgi:hypothetical protein